MAISDKLKALGKKMTGSDLSGNTIGEVLSALNEKYGSDEPSYEVVAEIEVGTMMLNKGLYFYESDVPFPTIGGQIYFNSTDFPLERNEAQTDFYSYNFDGTTPSGSPAYGISQEKDAIMIIADSDALSNTTVRILKQASES